MHFFAYVLHGQFKNIVLELLFISVTPPSRSILPLLISIILSQSSSTDAMLCVENRMVAPLSRISNISFFSKLTLIGSNPEKGSSNISSLGSCITVTINCIFAAFPCLVLQLFCSTNCRSRICRTSI